MSAKWRLFSLGLNELRESSPTSNVELAVEQSGEHYRYIRVGGDLILIDVHVTSLSWHVYLANKKMRHMYSCDTIVRCS